jgi:hypothetical protein
MKIMSIQMLYAISIAFVKKLQEIIFYFAFLSPNIWRNCQSMRLSPLISWGWLMIAMWKELVNALPKVVGTPVFSHRECWQNRLGFSLKNNPSIVAVLHDGESIGGCYMHPLRKPCTLSHWAVSFAIQLSSQLQVRIISTHPTYLPIYLLFKVIK